MEKSTYSRIPSKIKQARILKLIEKNPLTQPEIAELLHISEPHIRSIIREMHKKNMVHIKSWTNKAVSGQRNFLRKQWKAGEGVDAVRPKPVSAKERSKAAYYIQMSDTELAKKRKHSDHHRYLLRKFKSNPDIFMSWLHKSAEKIVNEKNATPEKASKGV